MCTRCCFIPVKNGKRVIMTDEEREWRRELRESLGINEMMPVPDPSEWE